MGLRERRTRVTLDPGAVWRDRPGRPTLLQVETGRVWLTADGSSHDMLLGPGDRLLMLGAGLVVIQAVGVGPAGLTLE